MKTVNIKGKNYVMVNDRIMEFRKLYPNYSLESEIVTLDAESVVIKAIIRDENQRIIATGYAQEDRTSTMINKTSYVENCETSAWGRALGNLGIGIDDSIASAEEVDMAIKKQEIVSSLKLKCACCGDTIDERVAKYSLSKYQKELCRDCQREFVENGMQEVDL